jgi:mono/diheme cytochrome c family protein
MVRRQSGFRRGAAGLAGAVVFSMAGGAVLAAGSAVETSSAGLAPGSAPAPAAVPAPASSAQTAPATPRAVLDRYCITCHNDRLRTGGLSLDAASVDAADPSRHADVWERVIAKLRTGAMPPPGRPRPEEATYDAVAGRLEADIDRAAAASPDPGRTSTVHRLNRTEYRNAIRDLLALDLDVEPLLPGDETSDTGFDNNADVLSISTAQLERYLSAARTITRLATGLPPTGPGFETFDVPLLLLQDERQSEDMPLGSRGGVAIPYHFPVDGDYLIKIELRSNWQDYILGMGSAHLLDVRIDGALVERMTVGGAAPGRPAPVTFTIAERGDPEWEAYLQSADERLEVRVPVEAGPRTVSVSFVRNLWEPEGILKPRQAGEVLSNDEVYNGNAAVSAVAIGGPYAVTGAGDTPSRRVIFSCRPETAAPADERACAVEIMSRLARRAYRRPVTAEDVDTLLGFFDRGRADGGSFDAGIQLALERMLVDPDFLLRIERDPAGSAPGAPYRLRDVEVASRLSFFLWGSLPDEPLLDAAEQGVLTEPAALEAQVRRMLADPRARSLTDDFAVQWLHLRNLEDVTGDPVPFPDFDDNLVEAFRQETTLFLASTLREDRSVLDLLDADYTFVNERLARHYGIPGIYGSRFRRVALPDREQRGGLLGHGGLLALTSYPTRTSPVLRGKWLLDTILGAPPPSPPADVPALPERGEGGRTATVRERLERHRQAPACATCHASIDPPGFALEQYDGLGGWRTADEYGNPVDATATLPSGRRVEGMAGLRAWLLERPEQFAGTVTEKLLSYALGRGLEHADKPTVRAVVREAAADDYRWSALVAGIVKSPAFLMRNAAATD